MSETAPPSLQCGQCEAIIEASGYWDATGRVPFCDAYCLDAWRGDGYYPSADRDD